MKGWSFISALAGAGLLCAMPLSVQWPVANGGSFSVTLGSSQAAELEMAPHRAYRYGHHYGVATYDLLCGGPYAHRGWNGGTYWGGPWMDLRCYGVPVAEVHGPWYPWGTWR
jgi:hypothetical protein